MRIPPSPRAPLSGVRVEGAGGEEEVLAVLLPENGARLEPSELLDWCVPRMPRLTPFRVSWISLPVSRRPHRASCARAICATPACRPAPGTGNRPATPSPGIDAGQGRDVIEGW